MSEPPNNDLNDAVLSYLRYYCDPSNALDYAVMVRGKWGAGKTYLINQFKDELNAKGHEKNLYVSLYGVTSFRQIDEALYRQLHPVLASKGMKLAATIGKAVLKATTKIDFDGKEDITLTSNIPDVDLSEYFKTPKECLLIFDDLERCSMKVSDILGYINSFVEHEGFKAIIVANEEEILKRPTKDEQYAEIKEKLIGQTLTIQATVDAAVVQFLRLIKNKKAKAYLTKHEEAVRLLHSQSGTDNLRLLKHAMWDFEKLASCLTTHHWKNDRAIGILFRNILTLSFEVRAGRITQEQLGKVVSDAGFRLFKKATDPETPADQLKQRYPEVEFDQKIASSEWIAALFFDGWIDPETTRKMLDASPYFASPESLPAWKVAWHGWDLSDEEYERAVATVEKQFLDRKFEILGELLQVFGLRLSFSNNGAIKQTRTKVVAECKSYIDELKKWNRLPDLRTYGRTERFNSWEGLGLMESQTKEFTEIVEHLDASFDAALNESLPSKGMELLELMRKDVQEVFRKLCLNNVTASPFFDIPVLAKIDPKVFVDHVLKLDPISQASVFSMFQGRYDRRQLDGDLKEERPWLIEVKKYFEQKMTSLRPMSRTRLKNRIGHSIDPLLG